MGKLTLFYLIHTTVRKEQIYGTCANMGYLPYTQKRIIFQLGTSPRPALLSNWFAIRIE